MFGTEDQAPVLNLHAMGNVSATLTEAGFLEEYIGDVEMSFGSSLLGHGSAARREVCKDVNLCGFNSNTAVASLFTSAEGSDIGTADSVRGRLLLDYGKVDADTLDQGSMCEACAQYLDPHMVSIDVWDSDYWWESGVNDKKGDLEGAKDDYLGGVYIDLVGELASGRRTGDYRSDGVALMPDEDRNYGTSVKGRIYFHWAVGDDGLLEVVIDRATDLANADVHGESDPYVKVSVVGGQCASRRKHEKTGCYTRKNSLGQTQARVRTEWRSNTLNPVWETTVVFGLGSQNGDAAMPDSEHGRIFAEAVNGSDHHGQLLSLRRAFGSRVACMHLGMCEYGTSLMRTVDWLTPGIQFGARAASIQKELVLKAEVDAHFDDIMGNLNTYPCRSIVVPKNLLLMFSTWRNLQAISKKIFRMRNIADDGYISYVRQRNQQVLRGLFHSDVMSNVPSYLRGLIEGAVTTMLTGQRISWKTFMAKVSVAFKRFALATAGRVLASPIMLAIGLLQLVMNGGKALFYDFIYKFLIKGSQEGKSASQLWAEAQSWVKAKGKEGYTAVKEALLGSDKCSGTADGMPSYVTGENATHLFTVNEDEDDGNSLMEVHDLARIYVSTGSHCGGRLNDQQFAIYDAAAQGKSVSEIGYENTYVYIGTCYRTETRYVYGYSCIYCQGPTYYDHNGNLRQESCGYCHHWESYQVPYACEKTGYYVGMSEYGNGWDFSRQWHINRMYSHASANPGMAACQLHELVVADGEAEAAVKQAEYEEKMGQALMVLMYIAISIYVVVYLVCVGNSFPSMKMIKKHTSKASTMVLKSTLGCALWPVTFKMLEQDARNNEDELDELTYRPRW